MRFSSRYTVQTVVSLHKVHNFLTKEDRKISDVLSFVFQMLYEFFCCVAFMLISKVIVMVAKTSFIPILRCGHMISYIPMYGNSVIFSLFFFNVSIHKYVCIIVFLYLLYILSYTVYVFLLVRVIAINNKQRKMLYLMPVSCNFVFTLIWLTEPAY
jgi:hypothetical protein